MTIEHPFADVANGVTLCHRCRGPPGANYHITDQRDTGLNGRELSVHKHEILKTYHFNSKDY
jgi:hypothetical protein